MKFSIVIAAHNEEDYLDDCLQSLVDQTHMPLEIVLIDDNSSDSTAEIMQKFSRNYDFIKYHSIKSSDEHIPGAKVVQAFNKGYEKLEKNFDVVCKFDADLIFPKDYLERIDKIFKEDREVGIAGGLPYVLKDGKWVFEKIASKEHVRGPLKAYRKACFEDIGGLRNSIGWDSADVLIAQYHGWKVKTDKELHVKHLKPTGATYDEKSRYLQGEAFYKLGFDRSLARLASLKGAMNRGNFSFYFDSMRGYNEAKKNQLEKMVDEDQAKFIRNLRWQAIKKKIL